MFELPLIAEVASKLPDQIGSGLKEMFGRGQESVHLQQHEQLPAPMGYVDEKDSGLQLGDIAPEDVVSMTGDNIHDIGPEDLQALQDWTLAPRSQPLIALLGPTTLPLTHRVECAEKSTRRVSQVHLPSATFESSKKDPMDMLARVELKLWTPQQKVSRRARPFARITEPEVIQNPLDKPNAEQNGGTCHNPSGTITILLEPSPAERLLEGIGIGLKGTFVQVVPRHASDSNGRMENKSDEKSSMRDGFWYVEDTALVIPSFWMEEQGY